MKTYICPDCGQRIDNNLHDCPNCGCPATMLKEVVQPETTIFDSNESINAQKRRQTNKKIVLWSSIIIVVGVIVLLANWERIQERLEWAEYYEWYYGTYKKQLLQEQEQR